MKVWKRCLSAVLAFMIFITSVNITEAAGNYDKENFIWTANDAAVVAGYYGLDENETAVLSNPAVNRGNEYTLFAPYDNETEGKNDLVTVDYVNQCVYAKALHTNGFSWVPTEAILSAAGEEEVIPLTEGVCYYNEVEYYANGAFTYSGNSYNVNVIYQLHLNISAEEQTRILEIPQILAQTSKNLEVSFYDIEEDLYDFIDMIPALNEMLSVEYIEKTEEGTETVETSVSLLDPVEDKEIIESIQILYQEYIDNGEKLIFSSMREDYLANYRSQSIKYAIENGEQLLKQSELLFDHVLLLKDSNLSNKCNKLKDIDQELYTKVKSIRTVLRGMQGTMLKPGELALLSDPANWRILDPAVQDRIFSDSYTDEDFAALEAAVYRLRNSEPEMPEIETETLLAAEIGVECDITYYEINISVGAEVATGAMNDPELKNLDTFDTIIKLLKGATIDEIRQAIENVGIENQALSSWNTQNDDYQISTVYYDREESKLPRELNENIEYRVSFSPKTYTLKTNFDGNKKVPFGYVYKLPVSADDKISYDYVVEFEDGTYTSYSEGSIFKINQSMSIEQKTGTEKAEYRLYDLLTTDDRHKLSDEAKSILLNTAVISPILDIRMPDSRKVSEIIYENGLYYIKAESSPAGILGMEWEPMTAVVEKADGSKLFVPFENEIAVWTEEDFAYVNVKYELKIEKVEGGLLGDRPLEAEEAKLAWNLPHNLVEEATAQNRLLNGTENFSAKILYEELTAVKDMMTPTYLKLLRDQISDDEKHTKDCIDRLLKDEKKGGGWNSAKNELALYSYLTICQEVEWSLAVCIKQGIQLKIAEQSKIVYECMNVIVNSSSVKSMLSHELLASYKAKFEKLEEMLPKLYELADEISELNNEKSVIKNYVNMEDKGYYELMNILLFLEGQTTEIEADDIYAYDEIQRNPGDKGTLTISVKIGSRLPKSEVYSYSLEAENAHKLTENDVATIKDIVRELLDAQLSEEEQVYYNCQVKIPEVGTALKKSADLFFMYSSNEYQVTIKDVPETEYKEVFHYTGAESYTITLPPYSYKPEGKCKYIYWIDDEKSKVVENGGDVSYIFTKEDLTTLFDNSTEACGKLEMRREEIVLSANVNAKVDLTTEKVKGYRESFVDSEATNLYLDVQPEGIKVSDFMQLVSFNSEDDFDVEIGELSRDGIGTMNANELVRNGSSITCTVIDKNNKPHKTTFQIILLGDVNKSGKLDTNDCWIIAASYSENMKNPLADRDQVSQLAADVNGNGCYTDSNDVWQILRKLNYWDSAHYTSILAQ